MCTKKTQFALVEKIKSFVVFKMRRGQLVVISSDEEDEVSMSKKPKLEESFVPNRDVFFIMKIIPGDGHCIVDILGESDIKVLNEVWQEFCNNVKEYMNFRENENSEQLLQCLQQYIFDKNYNHDTLDLVLEAFCFKGTTTDIRGKVSIIA